jgi:very-short-patch-repair endonuclease
MFGSLTPSLSRRERGKGGATPKTLSRREREARSAGEGASGASGEERRGDSAMRLRPASPLTKRARALRRDQTRAEALLWSALRGRRLEGRKFNRQFAIGPYVVDFVCWNERLIIEIDGGQHDASDGRDAERSRWLGAQGFSVMRFWNNEVLDNPSGVLAAIAGALDNSLPHPTLTPSLSRRERGARSAGEGRVPRLTELE